MNKVLLAMLGVAALWMTGCAQVQPQAVNDNEYVLTETYDQAPVSLESRRLSKQAENLCPKGYSFKLRQINAIDELASHQFECAQGKNCGYVLQWHVRCGEVPREPFSIFGKI